MIKTQRLAAAAVSKVLAGASLTTVLQDTWHNHPDLSEQQRGAIQDLSYGVLRFYGQLNAILGLLLKKPLKNKEISYLLLVALYQLEYSRAAAACGSRQRSVRFPRGERQPGCSGIGQRGTTQFHPPTCDALAAINRK